MIANAKTFDCATSCLADNSVAAHSSIYETLKWKLVERGGHVCASAEKARLQAVMWPKGERIPSIEVVAKPAARIAELAGIELAPDRGFLVVEEEGVVEAHPFSGEKLSVVLALYQYQGGIDSAVDLVNRTPLQPLQPPGVAQCCASLTPAIRYTGYTCGIHSSRNDHVLALALGTKTARVKGRGHGSDPSARLPARSLVLRRERGDLG
jgi:sulfoacetaldehyde dehydrogenase